MCEPTRRCPRPAPRRAARPQMSLLRLLALLGAGDKHTSENIYAVVAEVKRRAEPLGNNIGGRRGGAGRPAWLAGCRASWGRAPTHWLEGA